MAVQESYVQPRAPRLRRVARVASLALLALTILFLMGTDMPASEALRTSPFASACFLAMLFGLAISWEHPLHGGVTTAVAWTLMLASTHGASALPFAAFIVVGLLDLLVGWSERGSSNGT